MAEFDSLKQLRPFGDEMAQFANEAFATSNSDLFGVQIRLWIEKAVLNFLEAQHNLPPATEADLDAATTNNGRRPGQSQFRIDRALRNARGAGPYILQAMHRIRQFGNKANHGTPAYYEQTRGYALKIRDWLLKEYLPSFRSPKPIPKPAAVPKPYPTEPWPPESDFDPFKYRSPYHPIPPRAQPKPQPPPISWDDLSTVKPRPGSTYSDPPPSGPNAFALAVICLFVSFCAFFVWGTYRAVVAVEDWWAGLPSLSHLAQRLPGAWQPKQSTFAQRFPAPDPPAAPKSSPPPTQPSTMNTPAGYPHCPSGMILDSATNQCSIPPADQEAELPPPLSIVPDCMPGFTYFEQTASCIRVEANNGCPVDMYRPAGSQRCLSKHRYRYFRYDEPYTLVAGNFVQAPPVEESMVLHVLQGSVRVYYQEDPASAENVIQHGHGQTLYNYAILSCVICPAAITTGQGNFAPP